MKRVPIVLLVVAVCVAALVALGWWYLRPPPVLTVATWAGSYARAQANAMFRPYTEKHGVEVRLAEYDGGLADVRSQVQKRKYAWDVVDFELSDAVSACREGLLEPIDRSSLPPGLDGVAAAADFIAGALGRCWVGSVVYSQIILYSRERLGTATPTTLDALFDLARYPGRRALRSGPKYNLELALLADGVPADKVYPTLATEPGLARALAKLDSIRPAIVWWSRSDEAAKLVEQGQVAFATVLNGDAYTAAAVHHQPVGIIWDRQLYELDVFGVPRGDPRKAAALDFVRFATGSIPLARTADWVPYGPARRSSRRFVGNNPDAGIPMAQYLPTSHFARAFSVDEAWWHEHGAEIEARWRAWLDAGR